MRVNDRGTPLERFHAKYEIRDECEEEIPRPERGQVMRTGAHTTAYGFDWGPMRVERAAHDDRLGWAIIVRPLDGYEPQVIVRVSPKGRKWNVETKGMTQ